MCYNIYMKTKLNREFLARHLFVTVLMLALGAWFGYDGFVRYPSTPAHDLYVSIEKSEPPVGADLEAFKAQKTKTQHGLMALAILAGIAVGAHLFAVSRFSLSFDDDGFEIGGRRFAYADVKSIDDSAWKKKGISVIACGGGKVKLDSWHHTGVKEFHERLLKSAACAQNGAVLQ